MYVVALPDGPFAPVRTLTANIALEMAYAMELHRAALFACGMATRDFRPFLTIYSTFFQRAYDMAIHDIGIQSLPVRLCMDRAGLSGLLSPRRCGPVAASCSERSSCSEGARTG